METFDIVRLALNDVESPGPMATREQVSRVATELLGALAYGGYKVVRESD